MLFWERGPQRSLSFFLGFSRPRAFLIVCRLAACGADAFICGLSRPGAFSACWFFLSPFPFLKILILVLRRAYPCGALRRPRGAPTFWPAESRQRLAKEGCAPFGIPRCGRAGACFARNSREGGAEPAAASRRRASALDLHVRRVRACFWGLRPLPPRFPKGKARRSCAQRSRAWEKVESQNRKRKVKPKPAHHSRMRMQQSQKLNKTATPPQI